MKKLIVLVIALMLLTGCAMAQVIISTTTVDAIGNLDSSSEILMKTNRYLLPSDMVPSDNEVVYNQDTLSSGMVLILLDKEHTTSFSRFLKPPEDPPLEFNPDPRVSEVDPETPYMEDLNEEGRADQFLNISSAGTNFDTFRKSRNWSITP